MIPLHAASGYGAVRLSALWGNLTADTTPNANVTINFSGPARTFRIDISSGSVADLEYRINSGTYTNCPDETTFSIATGDTLNFRHNGALATAVVDIYANGAFVDSFNVNT